MTDDFITDKPKIRGTDSNSLLRIYDRVCDIFAKSLDQHERARADKARQRIAKELERRNVRL
jgi:hypothetical protein